jgi:hypothetical protein
MTALPSDYPERAYAAALGKLIGVNLGRQRAPVEARRQDFAAPAGARCHLPASKFTVVALTDEWIWMRISASARRLQIEARGGFP